MARQEKVDPVATESRSPKERLLQLQKETRQQRAEINQNLVNAQEAVEQLTQNLHKIDGALLGFDEVLKILEE
jgi:ABC-type transporter Mla subunit MlaD